MQFDSPFFQLGKGYVFELQCEKFEYSGENFDTGIGEIDRANITSTFPDLQLGMVDGGQSTFQQNERVIIYNLSNVDLGYICTQNGDPLLTENLEFINTDGIDLFQFFNDSGFMHQISRATGTVAKWNKRDKRLNLTNLSDMNPDQLDPVTGDVTINNFSDVLVIGEKSGAAWTSSSAKATPKAFDDASDIQKEFNEIKILDPADTNPFGFY